MLKPEELRKLTIEGKLKKAQEEEQKKAFEKAARLQKEREQEEKEYEATKKVLERAEWLIKSTAEQGESRCRVFDLPYEDIKTIDFWANQNVFLKDLKGISAKVFLSLRDLELKPEIVREQREARCIDGEWGPGDIIYYISVSW